GRAVAESFFRWPLTIPPALFGLTALYLHVSSRADSNGLITIIIGVLMLAPLAGVMVHRAIERTRRGPFIPDALGHQVPGQPIIMSRVFDTIATFAFVTAVAAGALALSVGVVETQGQASPAGTLPS